MLYGRVFLMLGRRIRAYFAFLRLRLHTKAIAQQARAKCANVVPQIYPYAFHPGDANRGTAWLMGDYTLPGRVIRAHNAHVFDLAIDEQNWVKELHSFDWARHVLARGDAEAAAYIKQCLDHWIKRPYRHMRLPMQPAIIARRLLNWSLIIGIMPDWFDEAARLELSQIMVEQILWLERLAPRAPHKIDRLYGALGMCWGALWCNDAAMQERELANLRNIIDEQILNDGGHISRKPEILPILIAYFAALIDALQKGGHETPDYLIKAQKRTQHMLRFLTYDDTRLAVFNGGTCGHAGEITALIDLDKPPRFYFAPMSGYQRLEHGKTVMMVDCGNNPPHDFSHEAHCAPLAFELAYDKQPIIVNCGPNLMHGPEWQLAARGMAAHSVLGFIDNMHDPYLRRGFAAWCLGAQMRSNPYHITARRLENNSATWLECDHDLYRQSHGVIYHRRFYMPANGLDLRGEELLLPARKTLIASNQIFALRFHLHPDMKASLDGRASSVLLRTPKGAIWRFQTRNKQNQRITLERSVYLGDAGAIRNTQQILITGTLGKKNARILWRFSAQDELQRQT